MGGWANYSGLLLASTALTPGVSESEVPRMIYHTAQLDKAPAYPAMIEMDELTPGECLSRAAVLSSLVATDPVMAQQGGQAAVMGACLNKPAYLAAKLKLGSEGLTEASPSLAMQNMVARYSKAGVGDVGFAYTCNPKDYPVQAQKLAITARRMLQAQESVVLPVDINAAAKVCQVTAGKPVKPAGYVTGIAPEPKPIPMPNVAPEEIRKADKPRKTTPERPPGFI